MWRQKDDLADTLIAIFQDALVRLVDRLDRLGCIKGMHFEGNVGNAASAGNSPLSNRRLQPTAAGAIMSPPRLKREASLSCPNRRFGSRRYLGTD